MNIVDEVNYILIDKDKFDTNEFWTAFMHTDWEGYLSGEIYRGDFDGVKDFFEEHMVGKDETDFCYFLRYFANKAEYEICESLLNFLFSSDMNIFTKPVKTFLEEVVDARKGTTLAAKANGILKLYQEEFDEIESVS